MVESKNEIIIVELQLQKFIFQRDFADLLKIKF